METALRIIYSAVEVMTELENQDRTLVIDMSQAMLWDTIQTGNIRELFTYVRQYCDAVDTPSDIGNIVNTIMAEAEK